MHEFHLPFGPQHPALAEPIHLKLKVDGETVKDIEFSVGYNHRGIERGLEEHTWIKSIYLSERICGICSNAHQSCFCQGIEKLLGIEIPDRAKYIRTIISELERIQSHMLWLALSGYEIGLDTIFHYVWRDREIVNEILERVSGNRIVNSMNTIGGVRRDFHLKEIKRAEEDLDKLEQRIEYYLNVFNKDVLIKKRLKNIGFLHKFKAKELNVVGPMARGSGINYDVRNNEMESFVYKELKFKPVIEEKGDVFSRSIVRIKEILESIRLVQEALIELPEGEIKVKVPRILPKKESISRVEAPRGELFYYIKSNGEKPYRVKIRTPTYANIISLPYMMKNQQVADIPIILVSLDPCIACCDRMTIVDLKTNKEKILTREEIRKMRINNDK